MTADDFIRLLLQFDQLNQPQIELIQSLLETKHFKPGDYMLEAGKVAHEVGFILDGVFRICYYDHAGNEITRYFLDEAQFIVDIQSYSSGLPSSEYIQAVTPCTLLVLSRASMETLSRTLVQWDRMVAQITAKAMAEKVGRVSIMLPQDATERYHYFLDKFPQLANRVPLQYIASYIGVTKSSLSRLRKTSATVRKPR